MLTSGSWTFDSERDESTTLYHSVLVVQMKNWEPLVFGPEFAIERVPAETETG